MGVEFGVVPFLYCAMSFRLRGVNSILPACRQNTVSRPYSPILRGGRNESRIASQGTPVGHFRGDWQLMTAGGRNVSPGAVRHGRSGASAGGIKGKMERTSKPARGRATYRREVGLKAAGRAESRRDT